MKKNYFLILICILLFAEYSCCQKPVAVSGTSNPTILPGAYHTTEYLPLLKGKNIGVVSNHTSLINKTHLVDTLLSAGIRVIKIFGPEHGFRGNQPDGKEINNSIDRKTGIEIISLYGNHKKPSKTNMEGVDLMIFDIQDVGVRFYTYISTLAYVMEACTENGTPLIVLDRPNPHGYYIDGPILEPEYSSFVGLHPVPVVYGMTIGEYATMINGEKWLTGGLQCKLQVIKCSGYTHASRYKLPVNPSPNLQDMEAIYLYPSLCFFEGTVVSIGRGTPTPFKVIGHPLLVTGSYTFTPHAIRGVSENPPLNGQRCYGHYLGEASELIRKNGQIYLTYLLNAYKVINVNLKGDFFNSYFDKLAGTKSLREQVIAGKSEEEIRVSWQPGLEKFQTIRKKYLLYPDFE